MNSRPVALRFTVGIKEKLWRIDEGLCGGISTGIWLPASCPEALLLLVIRAAWACWVRAERPPLLAFGPCWQVRTVRRRGIAEYSLKNSAKAPSNKATADV